MSQTSELEMLLYVLDFRLENDTNLSEEERVSIRNQYGFVEDQINNYRVLAGEMPGNYDFV